MSGLKQNSLEAVVISFFFRPSSLSVWHDNLSNVALFMNFNIQFALEIGKYAHSTEKKHIDIRELFCTSIYCFKSFCYNVVFFIFSTEKTFTTLSILHNLNSEKDQKYWNQAFSSPIIIHFITLIIITISNRNVYNEKKSRLQFWKWWKFPLIFGVIWIGRYVCVCVFVFKLIYLLFVNCGSILFVLIFKRFDYLQMERKMANLRIYFFLDYDMKKEKESKEDKQQQQQKNETTKTRYD